MEQHFSPLLGHETREILGREVSAAAEVSFRPFLGSDRAPNDVDHKGPPMTAQRTITHFDAERVKAALLSHAVAHPGNGHGGADPVRVAEALIEAFLLIDAATEKAAS